MPVSFNTDAKEALDLTPRHPLKLTDLLLASADGDLEGDSQAEWYAEIEARILAIDQGCETGIPFDVVMASAANS